MIPLVSNEVIEAHHQDLVKEADAYRRSRPLTRTRRFGFLRPHQDRQTR